MTITELTFKTGFAPVLGPHRLAVLRDACRADDPTLVQGQTTTPPPLMAVQDMDCEAACALGYCGWKGGDLRTVGEVEEFFSETCYRADRVLGEVAACRWFLEFWDDTPRLEAFATLARWIDDVLAATPAA